MSNEVLWLSCIVNVHQTHHNMRPYLLLIVNLHSFHPKKCSLLMDLHIFALHLQRRCSWSEVIHWIRGSQKRPKNKYPTNNIQYLKEVHNFLSHPIQNKINYFHLLLKKDKISLPKQPFKPHFLLIRLNAVLDIPCGSVLCVQSNFNGFNPKTLCR